MIRTNRKDYLGKLEWVAVSTGRQAARYAVLVWAATAATVAFAGSAPTCYDDQGNVVPNNNNAQVLGWKQSEPNGWLGRANVEGTVTDVEPDASGHNHFIIQIGPNSTDVVEVIYNYDFGALPEINVGDDVEACGDFIQSYAQNGPYAASPAGAILHWVHGDPRHKHPDGFVMVGGTVYGFDYTNANGGAADF